MIHTHLFQLSLEEAASFIRDCVQQSLAHLLQQDKVLALAGHTNTPQEDKLLTTEQVCELLHITRNTCDAWKKAGKLPYQRIGSRIYFSKQEILASIQKFNRRTRL